MKKINSRKIICFSVLFISFFTFFTQTSHAFFEDLEKSKENVFLSESLDLKIVFPSENENSLTLLGALPESKTSLSVIAQNVGSLSFQYQVKFQKTSGNDDLCSALKLKAVLNESIAYDGSLKDFTYTRNIIPALSSDQWDLEVSLSKDANDSLQNLNCRFDVSFVAWQTTFIDSDQGWKDTEQISSNKIEVGTWEKILSSSGDVVLNELIPNPTGKDSALMPNGEWIELYNNSNQDIDISNWHLEDSSGHQLEINSVNTIESKNSPEEVGVIIGAHDFLVVYVDAPYSHDFSLNNDGDSVSLLDHNNALIDYYSYGDTSKFKEGKTFARIPDGIGPWVDPSGTPGGKNELTGSDLLNAQLTVVSECFVDGKLIENEQQPLCAPRFVNYIGLIKNIHDTYLISEKKMKELVKNIIVEENIDSFYDKEEKVEKKDPAKENDSKNISVDQEKSSETQPDQVPPESPKETDEPIKSIPSPELETFTSEGGKTTEQISETEILTESHQSEEPIENKSPETPIEIHQSETPEEDNPKTSVTENQNLNIKKEDETPEENQDPEKDKYEETPINNESTQETTIEAQI